MKILQVTPFYEPDFHLGGIVRSTSILCRELVALGHQVTVFTTPSKTRPAEGAGASPGDTGGVEVVHFRNVMHGFGFDRAMWSAARGVERFDVVHVVAFWQLFGHPVLFQAARRGVPSVISPRGSLVMVHERGPSAWRHRAFYWTLNHRLLQRASAIHFTAEIERRDAEPLGLSTPSFRVPNALPVSEFDVLPPRDESRRRLGIDSAARVVLFLGRLDRRKALDVLVGAFARACGEDDSLLLLAGPDQGEEAALRGQVAGLGLGGRVRFLGLVDAAERARLFAAADLCALTSHAENFGNAAGEAMAAGLPVLVGDRCGVAEFVETYQAGRVVHVDVESVAEGLRGLLAQRTKLPALGANARRLVDEKYRARAVAETMARAYADVVSGTRSPECAWRP